MSHPVCRSVCECVVWDVIKGKQVRAGLILGWELVLTLIKVAFIMLKYIIILQINASTIRLKLKNKTSI